MGSVTSRYPLYTHIADGAAKANVRGCRVREIDFQTAAFTQDKTRRAPNDADVSATYVVDNLYAGYNGAAVLQGVCIRLGESEFVGVIGPNGSGKTTLLRSMSRVLAPIGGSVTLGGRDIRSIPAREFARRVAVVPQETLVAFDFTVLEIVLMGRSPRLGRFAVEGARDTQIALDALNRTATAHLAERHLNALSGGERQRVLVARALAQEPEALLLDEPTSHLDISFQFEIMDLVKSLNRERGISVVAVLHDLNLASQYCDRLILIGEGSVQADGSPDQVITAETIRRVYGAEVWVRKHPATSRPYVIAGVRPESRAPSERFDKPPRIHVIGGGGTAAPVLAKLARRGYALTCGVLNRGDADQEVADALDITYVSQQLFAQIAPESHASHLDLMRAADVVVLTDVPVGHGNIANIEVALAAARESKPVIALKPELICDRDFTEGRATELVRELVSLGARVASSVDEVVGAVDELSRG
jgi:iron complex transport system ATP-binding protein